MSATTKRPRGYIDNYRPQAKTLALLDDVQLVLGEYENHLPLTIRQIYYRLADLEREQIALRDEGAVVKTDKGTPVVNPRKSVVQMHASAILSLRRSLSLHARAQSGETRDIAKRRGQAKQVEAEAGQPDRSSLLAAPPESLQ